MPAGPRFTSSACLLHVVVALLGAVEAEVEELDDHDLSRQPSNLSPNWTANPTHHNCRTLEHGVDPSPSFSRVKSSDTGESDTASDGECTAVEDVPTRVIIPLRRFHSERHWQASKQLAKRRKQPCHTRTSAQDTGTYIIKNSIYSTS
jgi:hypothetical protein